MKRLLASGLATLVAATLLTSPAQAATLTTKTTTSKSVVTPGASAVISVVALKGALPTSCTALASGPRQLARSLGTSRSVTGRRLWTFRTTGLASGAWKIITQCGSTLSSVTVTIRPPQRLTLGSLLPVTGYLAFLGPAMKAGYRAAIRDINAAGGVFGQPIRRLEADSGDISTNRASSSVNSLVNGGAQVLIGPVSSSISLTVIDQVKARNRLLFAAGPTSTHLSDSQVTEGHFARTTPPDPFQGTVLAQLAWAAGRTSVGILVGNYGGDSYGSGVADGFSARFRALGGTISRRIDYDASASSFSGAVSSIKSSHPQAIVLIGFDESVAVIRALVAAKIGPQSVPLYLCDGNMGNAIAESLPAGTLTGVVGTIPGVMPTTALANKLRREVPGLTDYSYGPETYDAVVITALAASAAGVASASAIKRSISRVTHMGNTPCTTFAACRKLQKAGKPIRYIGASKASAFRTNGDPAHAGMGVWRFGSNGKISWVKTVEGTVPS